MAGAGAGWRGGGARPADDAADAREGVRVRPRHHARLDHLCHAPRAPSCPRRSCGPLAVAGWRGFENHTASFPPPPPLAVAGLGESYRSTRLSKHTTIEAQSPLAVVGLLRNGEEAGAVRSDSLPGWARPSRPRRRRGRLGGHLRGPWWRRRRPWRASTPPRRPPSPDPAPPTPQTPPAPPRPSLHGRTAPRTAPPPAARCPPPA